jgi:hypothetical protein
MKTLITIGILLSTTLAALAQPIADKELVRKLRLSQCLAQANADTRSDWAHECWKRPGGSMVNSTSCNLSRGDAAAVMVDRSTARGLCYDEYNDSQLSD